MVSSFAPQSPRPSIQTYRPPEGAMSEAGAQSAVCGQEALDLLNCVTQTPYDQEKCVLLLQSLRDCVINKKVKKFSLAEQEVPATAAKKA